MECIVYLNWLWHIDGSGILTGIIYTKIKNGKYILLLERIKDCIESDNLINIGEL